MEGYSCLQTVYCRRSETTQNPGPFTVMQFCRVTGKSERMNVCGKQMKRSEAGKQWKRGLEWKDTWETLGMKRQGVDKKGGNKKVVLCKTVWFGKPSYERGQEHCCWAFAFLLPQAVRSLSLHPFLNKLQFFTLCSSHISSGYPSFCLQLTGFFGTYLLACVRSNDLPHFLLFQKYVHHHLYWTHFRAWNLILFTHTERHRHRHRRRHRYAV